MLSTTHSISWNNCVGLGVDNTSVNMGCRNSIKTRVLNMNPAIYIMGCPCHIVHNIALKAATAFEEVSVHIMLVLTYNARFGAVRKNNLIAEKILYGLYKFNKQIILFRYQDLMLRIWLSIYTIGLTRAQNRKLLWQNSTPFVI